MDYAADYQFVIFLNSDADVNKYFIMDIFNFNIDKYYIIKKYMIFLILTSMNKPIK
jgi:hypothetical protein